MRISSQRFLAILTTLVVIAQLWLAWRYFGFLTGDDVEVLAEGFHRALGFPYGAWDIRCLFVPDVFVSPVIRIASWLGLESTRALAQAATLPFIALTAMTVVLVHQLTLRLLSDIPVPPGEGARRAGEGLGTAELAALVAATIFALHWIPLGFGSTVYPRTLAMFCIVAAALIAERRPFLAGVLVGLAFADRFSEIIFLIPILRVARNNWLRIIAGAAIAALLFVGAYDWLTWGMPFSSAIKFARLTLVAPDFASRVKYQAPWWYLANIARWCAPTMLPLLWFARKRAPWAFLIVPLIALSAIRHKEVRYLEVMIPFLAIAAGIGAAMLWRTRRNIAIALVAISIAWHLSGIRYHARKTMPAVRAAEMLGADPSVSTVTLNQIWAYGDRLYFGERMAVRDVGTPIDPARFALGLKDADAAVMAETDLDPPIVDALRREQFVVVKTFRDGPAKAVVVFRRAAR
jgi:phosphatidylinositol glycan class B